MYLFGRLVVGAGLVLLLGGFGSSEISFKSLSVAGESDGVNIPAVLGKPEGAGPFAAVVMIPSCAGLNPEWRADWVPVLAAAGYVTVGIENVKPRGMVHCLSRGAKERPFSSWIGDAYGALEWLATQHYVDIRRVAVVGFSNGGIILSKYMADNLATPSGHRFRAMVSIYAHCNGDTRPGGPPVSGSPRVPWLVLNGTQERVEMKGACSQLKGRPNVTFEFIEGAYHGWDIKRFTSPHTDPAGNVMLYSEDATRRSQELVLSFLANNMKN